MPAPIESQVKGFESGLPENAGKCAAPPKQTCPLLGTGLGKERSPAWPPGLSRCCQAELFSPASGLYRYEKKPSDRSLLAALLNTHQCLTHGMWHCCSEQLSLWFLSRLTLTKCTTMLGTAPAGLGAAHVRDLASCGVGSGQLRVTFVRCRRAQSTRRGHPTGSLIWDWQRAWG